MSRRPRLPATPMTPAEATAVLQAVPAALQVLGAHMEKLEQQARAALAVFREMGVGPPQPAVAAPPRPAEPAAPVFNGREAPHAEEDPGAIEARQAAEAELARRLAPQVVQSPEEEAKQKAFLAARKGERQALLAQMRGGQ